MHPTPLHADLLHEAVTIARTARRRTSPNPWVGCIVATHEGRRFAGATEPPGGRHAERVALDTAERAGADTRGATVAVTLEPCSHHGRTPPCADALIEAGVATVAIGVLDPDPRVSGQGVARLREAGIDVVVGVAAAEVERQLAAYLHHRRTGRPLVVAKLATTLDGRMAAEDGTSRWITGSAARSAVHELRADSDAILVGAGTVRADDPALTTRLVDGPSPRRIVLGSVAPSAKVHPCTEWSGSIHDLLHSLGNQGVLQLLVEGGPKVVSQFHADGLVDRYVFHLAPALMGDGAGVFTDVRTPTIADLWRGRTLAVRQLGDDVEIIIEPERTSSS